MANQEFKEHAQRYRKYVLTKLLGLKGLYIYIMQNFGAILVSLTKKIRASVKK
jgi:hypothetical protein